MKWKLSIPAAADAGGHAVKSWEEIRLEFLAAAAAGVVVAAAAAVEAAEADADAGIGPVMTPSSLSPANSEA